MVSVKRVILACLGVGSIIYSLWGIDFAFACAERYRNHVASAEQDKMYLFGSYEIDNHLWVNINYLIAIAGAIMLVLAVVLGG